jgi:hypothetical protein
MGSGPAFFGALVSWWCEFVFLGIDGANPQETGTA